MNRIKWYGPSIMLILTILVVMLAGPGVVREIAWAQSDAKIRLIKEGLADNSTLAQLSAAFRGVGQAVEPSVVHIQVAAHQHPQAHGRMDEDMLKRFFGPRIGPMVPPDDEQGDGENNGKEPNPEQGEDKYNVPRPYGNGSGWVYDDQGHIITNNHVVEGADLITVRFHDGSERTAKVVGTDPKTDVAVLKVDASDLHPASKATEPVEQGDIVFAFGSPFRFDFSMSQGIVSAKGRQLHIVGEGGYENFIQTDAAINPGNSGGPLCNIKGEVIGMNTAIASQTGSYNGLGFAIPVDMVKDVAEQILTHGKVVRGFLGIEIKDLDPQMAATFNYSGKGVLVLNPLEGGPADKAGIKDGDIITKINGGAVTSGETLRRVVADIAPGAKADIEIFRGGKTMTMSVVVAELPAQVAMAPSAPGEMPPKPDDRDAQLLRKLGFENLTTFTPELASQLKTKFNPGVIIGAVRPDSEAASVGLGPREIIVGVMGNPIKNLDEFTDALKKNDLVKGVRLRIVVGNHADYVVLRMPAEAK